MSEIALYVETGPRAGDTIRVPAAGATIGRSPYAEIDLRDPKVSRRHARIVAAPPGLRVEDLDSSNGTFVEGVRIRQRVLAAGESFEVGDTRMSVVRPEEEPILGRTIAGLRILRRTGEALPARYYAARQEALDRTVRIEVLTTRFLAETALAARYRRAVRAASGLSHPDLLRVYDWIEGPEGPLVVVEPEEGIPLRAALLPLREVPPAARLRLAGRLIEALEEVERAEIPWPTSPAHMVWTPDARLRFRAPDARDLWEVHTGEVLRDPDLAPYVSPERCAGAPEGEASRVHVAACLAYAILCLEPPFSGADAAEILRAHREGDPPDPAERAPDLPRPIARAIRLALSPDPEARPPSLDALRRPWRRTDAAPLVAPPAAVRPTPPRPRRPAPAPRRRGPRRRLPAPVRLLLTLLAEALVFAASAAAVYVAMRILRG